MNNLIIIQRIINKLLSLAQKDIYFFQNSLDSHPNSFLSVQKISPDGKAKIQLQIVLLEGGNSTFHFSNKAGMEAQVEDRNKVKELVNKLLPNFRRKIDKDLEDKKQILSENPNLFQLYKDLVPTQIVSCDEFWNTYGKEYNKVDKKQEVAVSGSFLADIKPVSDGCNGVKYNLTSDMIECIFKTYPVVKKKYVENVPTNMSESDFWIKFFQSHYFHKDRIVSGFRDIFSDCDKVDEMALQMAIRKNLGDPLLDLTRFGDNCIDEDFCSSSYNDSRSKENSGNIVNQSIVKRFNNHSFQVLKTLGDNGNSEHEFLFKQGILKSLSSEAQGKKHKNKDINIDKICSEQVLTEEEMEREKIMKSKKIMEKIHYEDLAGDSVKIGQANASKSINLEKLERYLFAPVPSSNGHDLTSAENIKELTGSWGLRTPHKSIINATSAVNALGELSPGGLLMQGLQEHNLSHFVPPDLDKELRHLYIAARELLKSFWSSFPVTTKEAEEKVTKAHDCLQRFYRVKVKPMEDRLTREIAPLGNNLLKHLNLMMQTAFEKFISLQEKKNKKK